MEKVAFNALERKDLKKSATRRLRKEGKIPGIVYGYFGTLPIAVDAHDFRAQFHHISENTLINLTVGDKQYEVLIKEYQMNALKGRIEHLDFLAVQKDKTVRTHIPIQLVGSAKGVREGGILEVQLHSIEIECLPSSLPSQITVDISHLEGGHALHVKDLSIPPDVKVLTNADQVVASVVHARGEVAAQAVQAPTAEAASAESSPKQADVTKSGEK
ncbi:MAG: 50S ribosomal protein L25 [Spirochaetales bacterium]